jgi:uncharacterized protein YndB with AHSA1/START domain
MLHAASTLPEPRVVTTHGYNKPMTGIVATAEIDIAAPPTDVWAALTEPAQIKRYMFGSTVETNWQPGGPITWSGEYNGEAYQDKGDVVTVEPETLLEITHYSPMSGAEDVPENYHRLTYRLAPTTDGTHVTLSQDNNPDEDAAEHARQNWAAVLTGLKDVVEGA